MGKTDDSSNSSDDDFLTESHNDGNSEWGVSPSKDRESLVRQKLLENFYGKSAVAAATAAAGEASGNRTSGTSFDDDEDDEDRFGARAKGTSGVDRSFAHQKNDLDSPMFDAWAHTQRHVHKSKVHDLLQVEERLALQVRTLDSTMQTLVYENYSRFIDATDAIRSIGVHVEANKDALHNLCTRVTSLDTNSKDTELALGALRDQVAEKIRIKRLLSRLDALLKLPVTLEEQIHAGKYRMATRAYFSASNILSQHSDGFESLRNIETQCTRILKQMNSVLARKLLHWNGRLIHMLNTAASALEDSVDENPNEALEDAQLESGDDATPALPKSMTEIFECAGTLHILFQEKDPSWFDDTFSEGESEIDFKELPSLAVGAAARALDRILDAHLIQVQELRFASPAQGLLEDTTAATSNPLDLATSITSGGNFTHSPESNPVVPGSIFVPREFLDAILQIATLYGMTFGDSGDPSYLTDFITDSFSSFLSHVRSILLEETAFVKEKLEFDESGVGVLVNEGSAPDVGSNDAEEEEADVQGEKIISSALAILVQSVREMSSGLALPEVGVSAELCHRLVQEALQLSDSMVTRRVHQKFHELRLSIVQSCLVPFVDRLAAIRDDRNSSPSETAKAGHQAAGSTLSNCLQLIDDAIRSILSKNSMAHGDGSGDKKASAPSGEERPEDETIVKLAVQESTRQLADWLASALEVLAGGELSDGPQTVEVPMGDVEGEAEGREEGNEYSSGEPDSTVLTRNQTVAFDDFAGEEELLNIIHSARATLASASDGDYTADHESVLAIAEMCRLAEVSLSSSLDQSIASLTGGRSTQATAHQGTKKRSRRLFPSGLEDDNQAQNRDDKTSLRFRLAASRIFSLYAAIRGREMGEMLCWDLATLQDMGGGNMSGGPRDTVCRGLGLIKEVTMDCWKRFDDSPSKVRPFPELEEPSGLVGGFASPLPGFKSALHMDMDRIFKERVHIFLHPSELMPFSTNTLVFTTLKISLRAFMESLRMYSFGAEGYFQLIVDVEFLKLMVPYYLVPENQQLSQEQESLIQNILADVMATVDERCRDENCTIDERIATQCRSVLRVFMNKVQNESTTTGAEFQLSIPRKMET